ncbi:MAG: hypothetical protein CL904_04680 [Dehalococcoidia bacterium]|nr:hypothetical protein [Dehalococcoidia bacterium]MQG16001.1 hypothetical protein [SAR202 cluster bacterium]
MNESKDKKLALIAELTENAVSLWGAKRTEAAANNIREAANHILKVNEAKIDDSEAPLFHPPIQNPNSSA